MLFRSKRILQERDKIVADAQEEGAQVIARARDEAARLVSDHELRRQAQARAERVLEEARRQAQVISQGADEYAVEVLTKLAEELVSLQRTIANGIGALERRRFGGEVPPPAPAGDAEPAADAEQS